MSNPVSDRIISIAQTLLDVLKRLLPDKERGEDEDDDSLETRIFCINRVKDSQYLVGSSSRVVLYDLERRKVLK